MMSGYQSLIFLLAIVPFISSLKIASENENEIQHFPPNQKEVEECEKDISKCHNFSTYPRSYIENLIKKNIIKKEWFKDDKNELTNLDYSDNNEYTSLCESIENTVYLQGKMTENREFIYIVQAKVNDAYYYQPIITRSCDTTKSKCCLVKNTPGNGKPDLELQPKAGETTDFKCIQKQNERELIGVAVNGTVIRDKLYYNSFCVCEYCRCRQNYSQCPCDNTNCSG